MLAALFYLRIFIEQFARRVTGKTGKVTGDKIMDAYNETIPPKHRDSMPSLREWYDKLSAPIHEASDDAETIIPLGTQSKSTLRFGMFSNYQNLRPPTVRQTTNAAAPPT